MFPNLSLLLSQNDNLNLLSECCERLKSHNESQEGSPHFLGLVEFSVNVLYNFSSKTLLSDQQAVENLQKIKQDLFIISLAALTSLQHVQQNSISECSRKISKDYLLLNELVNLCLDSVDSNGCASYLNFLLSEISNKSDDAHSFLMINSFYTFFTHDNVEISKAMQMDLLDKLDFIFCHWQEQNIAQVFIDLIPNIWQKSSDKLTLLERFWKIATSLLISTENLEGLNRGFFLLCGFFDVIFNFADEELNPIRCQILDTTKFRSQLQSGFVHSDILTRKRAMYLLKKVFKYFWSSTVGRKAGVTCFGPSKATVWNDFMLLMETMEETQFHIIDPVLFKLDSLLGSPHKENSYPPQFHQSWFLTALRRMINHDCVFVRRYSVSKFLSMDSSQFDFSLFEEFFCKYFLPCLQDSALYYRSPEDEPCDPSSLSSVTEALGGFFQNLNFDKDRTKHFLVSLLDGLSMRSWNGTVLCAILLGASSMKQNSFISIQEFLPSFRTLISSTIVTFDNRLKQMTGHLLLVILFRSVHLASMTPEDFLSLVTAMSVNGEFFRQVPVAFTQMTEWLGKGFEEFGSCKFEAKFAIIFKAGLKDWLNEEQLIHERYSHSELISDSHCTAIVRALLLVRSAARLASAGQGSQLVTVDLSSVLLEPLVDVLSKVGSHAYLSEFKVERAFLLLLTLLEELNDHNDGIFLDQVSSILNETMEQIAAFITRKLTCSDNVLNYSTVRLYQACMRAFVNFKQCRISLLHSSLFQQFLNWSLDNLRKFSSVEKQMSCLHLVSLDLLSMTTEMISGHESDLPRVIVLVVVEPLLRFVEEEWNFQVLVPDIPHSKFIDPQKMYIVRNHVMTCQLNLITWRLNFVKDIQLSSLLSKSSSSPLPALSTSTMSMLSVPMVDRFSDFIESAVDSGSLETCRQCCKTLLHVLEKVNRERACVLISQTWRKLMEFSKKKDFPKCFEAFVFCSFHLRLINDHSDDHACDKQKTCGEVLLQIFSDVLDMADERTFMLEVLLKVICEQIKDLQVQENNLAVDHHLLPLVPCLARTLVFGPLQDRSARFHNELLKKYEENYLNLKSPFPTDAHSARAMTLHLLLHILPANESSQRFGFNLLLELMTNCKTLSTGPSRCYGNSVLHRAKHRTMVAISLLKSFILSGDRKIDVASPSYTTFLLEIINHDNQPSIRFIASWLYLIQCIDGVHSPDFHLLLQYFEEADHSEDTGCNKKKPAVLSSMFVMMSHLICRTLKMSRKDKRISLLLDPQIIKCMDILLHWCSTSHSITRTYAQAAILFLKSNINEIISLESIDEKVPQKSNGVGDGCYGDSSSYCALVKMGDFFLRNKSTYRLAFQLVDSLHFKFDPWLDFSLEALLSYIPPLTGLSTDECMDISYFSDISPPSHHHLPARMPENRRIVWEECLNNSWRDNVNHTGSNKSNSNKGEHETIMVENVQKKLVPWKNIMLSNCRGDENSTFVAQDIIGHRMSKVESSGDKGKGGLIFVVSLVERIPNLGGLCRTCEVFGVTQMVVNNIKVINDVNFEKLSVTAHKWMDIEEVPQRHLAAFLIKKKIEGYSIVGLEQTSKSESLEQHKFKKKCVVVLGNEKSGIPVDIIQLMDVCLEIPQQGVVRSLNVHVSGALLLWEYFKQINLSSSSEEMKN